MKKRFLFLILCLGLILVFSCSRGSKVDGRMQCAYQLLNTHPDSALMLLSNYDVQAMSPETRAYYSLVYTMAQDKCGYDVNSDSLLGYAYRYYKDRENDSLYAKCNYYMGKLLYMNGDIKNSLDLLYTAEQVARKDSDLYTQYLAWDKIAMAYRAQNPEEAVRASRKAYDLYTQYDSLNLYNKVFLLMNIGYCYESIHYEDSAFYYMKQALHWAESSENEELIGDASHALALVLKQFGQYSQALDYAKKSWRNTPRHSSSSYLLLADCYLHVDSLQQSERLLLELVARASGAKTKYSAYRLLHDIESKKSKDWATIHYSDSALYWMNQVYSSSAAENGAYQKDKIEIKNELETKSSLFRKYVAYSVTLLLLLLFALFSFVWGFRNYRQLSEQKIQNIKEREKAEREQIENQVQHDKQLRELEFQSALVLERAKSEAELDKQRSILNVINKQNHLLKQHLLLKFDFHSLNEKLRKGECVDVETEEFWADMEAYLDETFSDFMFKFRTRHPALKEHDVRFCMLVKLGFDNAELRRIYNRGDQAIKQRLLNLKAKLGIEHTGLSTRDYILSFENSFSL